MEALPNEPYAADCRGTESARRAVCDYLKGRALIEPLDLLLTASTSEAYAYLLLALCDVGDAILVPSPGYPLLDDIAQLLGVRLVHYSLAYDGQWFLDSATLPTLEQVRTQNIRAVVAISPHHPTGHVLSEKELGQLGALSLPVIVDEVFEPYVLDRRDTDAEVLGAAIDVGLLCVLGGLSKSAAAPGLKLGWLVARGAHARQFLSDLEWISDAFLSVNQPVQQGLARILAQAVPIQTTIRTRLYETRDLVLKLCDQSPVTALCTRAGWSMILRLPHVLSEASWCELLLAQGVRVHPGRLYALPFPCSVVVSLLTEPSQLKLGLERLLLLVHAQLTDDPTGLFVPP
jgi:alanine-synthesizing transaminase